MEAEKLQIIFLLFEIKRLVKDVSNLQTAYGEFCLHSVVCSINREVH